MSDRLPSRRQAFQFLRRCGCQNNVLRHCEAVAGLALEIAEACRERGQSVDIELVEIGALLHDIGRSKTHSVHHAVIGAEMAKSLGLPEPVISIVKRHVGGGITGKEAKKLGWPRDTYIPQTLEEKIVSYADKLIEGSRRVPIQKAIQNFNRRTRGNALPSAAIERIQKLHTEMITLIGDFECSA